MMMTNGFGAYFGTVASSWAIGKFYVLPSGNTDWQGAWLAFAIYALVVTVLFAILFRDEKKPVDVSNLKH